jgi:hypothetical protein
MPSKSSVPCKRLFSSISGYEFDLHYYSGIDHNSSRDRGEFTDVVLNHDVEGFNVHRIIICPQSKVFYKACTGEFKVALHIHVPFVANNSARKVLLALLKWDICPIWS